ncbi:ABC transporter ATP-binding protein [Paraburkholderia caledonica]|uniref:ABC transporter ATP-binding protein n=1 Tax=Paraburkholderia caledonica TaxID=134536 RepID=UPI00036E9A7E|nr:ABC transporter ATP-binding protein [Paraburkholderia caledonica]
MQARSLILDQVSKTYDGQHRAVDCVSLDVQPGEFVSFLGPSGSGKTTTLMMIAGFEHTTTGAIRVAGRAIDKVPAYARNIGMVFQNYALFPHLSVADNVAFPLRMRGVAKTEKQGRVKAALEMVGLGAYASRHPAALSGGQQQRVALARALVFEPDVVLLDEPLGALDKSMREHMQVELKRIHRDLGVTMIYVTHDQTEAMTMSDRIAVFNEGRIEQIGTPDEVYFEPATRFVASFVGDSNLFVARALGGGRFALPGADFVGRKRFEAMPGAKVDVLLRPEMIHCGEAIKRNQCDVQRQLLIETMVNYGDSVLLSGRCDDTALRVRVRGPEARELAPGVRCAVGWKSSDLHVVV